ncbi:hypothetical protein CIPAW_16G061100 [Carya illinoinensis]|uniref:Uncharacterized protein n=1 Tax=Carya illinoinensis TaxID=32201 RepID=A0A8T1N262_CARIL|nr:hypothetical protein CIPAW_16G061100 [Carya illinoinensis]
MTPLRKPTTTTVCIHRTAAPTTTIIFAATTAPQTRSFKPYQLRSSQQRHPLKVSSFSISGLILCINGNLYDLGLW